MGTPMVKQGQVTGYEILLLKVIPLAFAIPLFLRIFPLIPEPFHGFFQFNVESVMYAIILYVMSAVSFIEMGYAERKGRSKIDRLSAGAMIMILLGITGLILGTLVLVTGFTFATASTIGEIIAWYMLIMILIITYAGRLEIFQRRRLLRAHLR